MRSIRPLDYISFLIWYNVYCIPDVITFSHQKLITSAQIGSYMTRATREVWEQFATDCYSCRVHPIQSDWEKPLVSKATVPLFSIATVPLFIFSSTDTNSSSKKEIIIWQWSPQLFCASLPWPPEMKSSPPITLSRRSYSSLSAPKATHFSRTPVNSLLWQTFSVIPTGKHQAWQW